MKRRPLSEFDHAKNALATVLDCMMEGSSLPLVSRAKFGVLVGSALTGGVEGGGGVWIDWGRERNTLGAPLPPGSFMNFCSVTLLVGRSSKTSSSLPSPKFRFLLGLVSKFVAAAALRSATACEAALLGGGAMSRICLEFDNRLFGLPFSVSSDCVLECRFVVLALTLWDLFIEDPAGIKGLRIGGSMLGVSFFSTGVVGRIAFIKDDIGTGVSVLEGGRLRGRLPRGGGLRFCLIFGMDRFSLRS